MASINACARKLVDIIGGTDGIAFQLNALALNTGSRGQVAWPLTAAIVQTFIGRVNGAETLGSTRRH